MANNCWNYAVFSGDKDALDEIQERFSKYNETNYFTEFGDLVLKKEMQEDYSSLSFDECYQYGTKWWDFNIDERTDNTLIISGDSAWSPPLELLRQISEVYNVTIEGEYNECGMDFGGFFVCEDGCLSDNSMTYFEYQLESDREWAINDLIDNVLDWDEEFDEDAYPQLTQQEKEYIKEQLKKEV
jgi:hypothetical protein